MKIVISHMLSDEPMKLLKESGAEIYVAGSADPESFFDELKDADCFINRLGEFRESVIRRLPKLKVIGRHAVGYDNIDVACATSLGIPVVFTPGANSRSVAEHAVALMFALAKDLENADPELRAGNWKVRDAGRTFELYGKKVGIVGIGAIGNIVAQLCRGVGMQTAGYSHSHNRAKVEAAGCEYYENLDDLLRECDIVTIHNPLTPNTLNMIGERELGLMKKTALLINTSRGPIVNSKALADALNNGVIAGAAVDVFDTEPAKSDDPVFTAKNLIATPHLAALTREAKARMGIRCVEGCLAVLRGERWNDVVDKSVYEHENFR